VLHALTSLDERYGGPLRLVLDLSARAEALGLESEVLGLGDPEVHDNPLDPSKIHSVPVGKFGGSYGYSPELRKWLAENVDRFGGVVVHGAWTYHGWAVAMECGKAGIPYAYFPHGMLEKWAVNGQGPLNTLKKRFYWQLFERRICSGSKCSFFTTEREMELSPAVVGESRKTMLMRPYGMDAAFAPTAAPSNPALFQLDGMNVALFLGRLHPKKNVAMLIDSWRLAKMPADWRLVIAGSGDAAYERELRALVQKHGLGDQIQFANFVHGNDKTYLLQRAAWFLLPSSQENFGVAVLEAVQHGCAVAISEGVYLAESFRPESEVLPVRAEAWTQFFSSRMRDLASRQRVRDLDRDHLMKTFGMTQITESWVRNLADVFSSVSDPIQVQPFSAAPR
jgi:glycosyltransferase involved in cell wall biosynthesis